MVTMRMCWCVRSGDDGVICPTPKKAERVADQQIIRVYPPCRRRTLSKRGTSMPCLQHGR
jgi:hypothetical protein